MKRIGFIGAFDKSNFIMCIAKILKMLDYNVLVIDATLTQKIKYIVPSINPTKTYITSFEDIDFAIGFENMQNIEGYLGVEFYTKKTEHSPYDYVLIDVDNKKMLDSFEIENADKNYFVTSFDLYSLRRGMAIFEDINVPIKLTKILFSYQITKESEEYLNYISMEYRVEWNSYTIYFQILGEDNKTFEDNQRLEIIRFKKLSTDYKEALSIVASDIEGSMNISKIKRIIKEE